MPKPKSRPAHQRRPRAAAPDPEAFRLYCDPDAPLEPGVAKRALALAARALAEERLDDAERYTRVAAQLSKLVESFPDLAPKAPASTYTPKPDEVIVTLDHLWDMVDRWATSMVVEGLPPLPAFLVRKAAAWRSARFGPEADAFDRQTAAGQSMSAFLYDPETGEPIPPLQGVDQRRHTWGETVDGAFPHTAQLPPGGFPPELW
jgi:hypothetical protein